MSECPKCGAVFAGRTIGSHVKNCPQGVTPVDLLWQKVDKSAPSGCWVWTGYCQKFGHGWLGKHGLAHRLAWESLRGPVPAGKFVLHHCDNPPCCNPDHLYIGDHKANARDKFVRGRTTRGERNHTAILTEQQAREILSQKPPKMRVRGLAASIAGRYNVGATAVYAIWRGDAWAYLREERQ